jgi:hypothetical protein
MTAQRAILITIRSSLIRTVEQTAVTVTVLRTGKHQGLIITALLSSWTVNMLQCPVPHVISLRRRDQLNISNIKLQTTDANPVISFNMQPLPLFQAERRPPSWGGLQIKLQYLPQS